MKKQMVNLNNWRRIRNSNSFLIILLTLIRMQKKIYYSENRI